jgi:hypothetical protein
MTSEGARLKAHLKLVGEAKAESHRQMTAAHLARPAGERLERGIAISAVMIQMHRETSQLRQAPAADDDAETWARIYRRLHPDDRRDR